MRVTRLFLGLGALLLPLLAFAPASAAPAANVSYDVGVCDPVFPQRCIKPNADGTVNITGTISASQAAFAPTGQASLSVSGTSARVALPSASPTATVQNTGANTAYVLFGDSSVVVTTSTGYPILPNSTVAFAVGTNTYIAGITATSTSTLAITTGTGVPALAGGGVASGGGGAVTIADGADVTQGALADAACATDNGTCTVEAVIKRVAQRLTTINTTLGTPLQAGGTVVVTGVATATNQTNVTGTKAPGTAAANSLLVGGIYNSAGVTLTNGQQAAFQFNSAGQLITNASGGLAQGSTTSGQTGALSMCAAVTAAPTTTTANTYPCSIDVHGALRVLNMDSTGTPIDPSAATPAGTNIIGKVGIDQTTPGTTNGVVNNAAAVGGSTPLFTSALSTTVTAIKASAGSLYMLRCYNPNASVAYVQVFNVASGSVTLGTTTPTQSYGIAATSPGGFALAAVPIAFSTAMSYASTTTATGNTANGTALTCNVAYN